MGAPLRKAKGAKNFAEGVLEEAILSGAHMECGELREANFEDAILVAAHLEFADLSDARFECSDIELAHLEGACLSGAMGLDREQIDGALIDDKTILPDYLREQSPDQGIGGE